MAQNKDFRVKNGLVIGAGSVNEQTFPATRGSAGQVLSTDGSGNLTWSPSQANVTSSENPPSNPSLGDLWYDTSNAALHIYYDNYWIETAVSPVSLGYSDFTLTSNTAAGSGSLTYDNQTGAFVFTPPDLSSYLTSETTTSLTFSANTLTYTDETGTSTDINLSAYASGETLTSLALTGNTLSYVDENGTTNNIDLSVYLDDTTNTISSAALVGNTITFTREDATTFTLDVSNLYDDTNLVTSVSGRTGAITLTKADITDFSDADYEPADATILKDADIGVNVQAYDADIVSDANYVHIDVTSNSVTDGTNTFTQYNDTALAGRVTTLENAGYLTAETTTSLSFAGDTLSYTDETGTTTNIDLSAYMDEDSRAIASGVLNSVTGIVTFTRDDASTFTLDLSGLLDDTNLVTSVAGKTGVVTLTKADITDFSDADYEPADATILKDADIGVTVQAYDANLVSDANYNHITVSTSSVSDGTNTFTKYDDATLSGRVTTLETAGYLTSYTETDPVFNASPAAGISATNISNWNTAYGWGDHSTAGYLTSFTETNDLTAAVTWTNVPDANITETSVTQHESALTITESQISDLQTYLTSETTTSLAFAGSTLTYTDETGTATALDLSSFLDEDSRSIASGVLNTTTGIVTFTRDDTTTFTLDLSGLLDDTNLVTSVAGKTGVVTLVKADITDFVESDYEPADATILKDADIGVTVQAYDADLVSDATYAHITVTSTSVSDGATTFNQYDDAALSTRVTNLESAGYLTSVALADNTDVTLGSPANNHVLQYNGTNWVNGLLNYSQIEGTPTALSDFTNDTNYATLDGTETLTNKTITSPTISNPTLIGNIIMPADGTIGSASDTTFVKFDETSTAYGGTDMSIGSNQSVHVLLDMNADDSAVGGFTVRTGANSIDNSTEILKVDSDGMNMNGDLSVTGTVTGSNLNVANWNTAYGWGDHSIAGYLTSFTETNDLTSTVTWADVPDANITETSVAQHQAALSITESQISDLQAYLTGETVTSLALNGNLLVYIDEGGTPNQIDLSSFLDEDARAINTGVLNSATGIVTFTRDDASTFTLDLSALLDDTNLVTSVAGKAGVVTLVKADITDFNEADYEPADATILKDADIGVTVQAYNANTVIDANYAHIAVTGTSVSDGTTTFNQYDDTTLSGRVTTLENAGYLTSETTTSLSLASTTLTYTDETGAATNIDLSSFLDDTNLVTSVNGQTGAVTITTYTDADADARIAAASIGDLSDVDITTAAPTDTQVLKWDNTNSKFVPGDAASSVSNLTDVDLTGLTNNSVLKYDSTAGEWIVGTNSTAQATANVIVPFAYASVAATSNGSGTNVSWSNWNSTNATLDFTFGTAQPNTNYTVITDSETFDDYFVGITNKTTTGFRASFYDTSSNRSPSSFSPFAFVVYGETPTETIYADSYSSVGDLPDVDLTTNAPTDGQILHWVASSGKFVPTDKAAPETTTALTLNGNSLDYTDETGTTTNIDLSAYMDEDARAISTGTLNSTTGIVTFTRDDTSTFTLDLSGLLDDTNLVTSVAGKAGVVTLVKADITDFSEGAGSGLDADLLDSQEGSYYLDYSNATNTPTITDETASTSTYYPLFSANTTGNIGSENVSSTKLYFQPSTGTLSATELNTLSDAALKDNIVSLENSKEILRQINPVSFTWKDSGEGAYGVIAQEIEQILPELVRTNDTGTKSVAYNQLIAFLINTVNEQQDKIDAQEQVLNDVLERLAKLEKDN